LKIRQLLYTSKATPFLTELGSLIDLFTENFTVNALGEQKLQKQVPPLQEENQTGQCKDIAAFIYVVQLLTGELLGHENYLDCHSEIQHIVRNDVSEICNVTPSSCNQQQSSNAQDQTGEPSSCNQQQSSNAQDQTGEPSSCNQQQLSNAQDQTGEESVLWNYGSMVPGTYSAEISNRIQQLRDEILSHGIARVCKQCGFHTRCDPKVFIQLL